MKAVSVVHWVRDLVTAALIGTALLLLGACGSAQQLGSAPRALQVQAVATLATNPCEAATAAEYTALIVARNTAARQVRDGRLAVADAVALQGFADEARAELDAACRGGRVDEGALARARVHQAEVKQLLGSR